MTTKMKRDLFNKDETWTDDAMNLRRHIWSVLVPIMEVWGEDFPIRQIAYVMIDVMHEIHLNQILDQKIRKRDDEDGSLTLEELDDLTSGPQ